MNNEYYIIGAGGFAKEVLFLTQEVFGKTSVFKGFIDQDLRKTYLTVQEKKIPIITEDIFLSKIDPALNVHLFIGVGDVKIIEKITRKFSMYQFPNLIHPNFIGDKLSVQLEKGNIIAAGCVFTIDIQIGSFNVFNLNTTVGHDTVIGNCNVFNPGTNISGSVIIGNRNLFGTSSTILQLIEIKDDNVLGASSLVTKNVSNKNIMVGVPAKNLIK